MEDARALLAEIDRPAQEQGRDPRARSALRRSRGALEAAGGSRGRHRASVRAWRAHALPADVGAESLAGREFSVAVYAPGHALLLRADPETLGILDDLIDELDRPPPTIDVEVLVLQVICDASLDLGFDAFIPLTTPKSPHDWFASVLLNPSGGGLLAAGRRHRAGVRGSASRERRS